MSQPHAVLRADGDTLGTPYLVWSTAALVRYDDRRWLRYLIISFLYIFADFAMFSSPGTYNLRSNLPIGAPQLLVLNAGSRNFLIFCIF